MSISAQIKQRIATAMRSNNAFERDALKVILGEVQTLAERTNTSESDELCEKVIRKSLASLNEFKELVKNNIDKTGSLNAEISILESLLPATLTVDEIISKVPADLLINIKSLNLGQATGTLMKFLKANKFSVLGKDVSAAVVKMKAVGDSV